MTGQRRHAKGYEQYRKATGTRRHSVPSTWRDEKGEYCSECAYPVAPLTPTRA